MHLYIDSQDGVYSSSNEPIEEDLENIEIGDLQVFRFQPDGFYQATIEVEDQAEGEEESDAVGTLSWAKVQQK